VAESLIEVPGNVAVMVVAPTATLVARPLVPEALLTSATPVSEEDQVTVVVRSWLVLSEYAHIAVNCFVCPRGIVWFNGVTEQDTTAAAVTVRPVELLIDVTGSVAVIKVVPKATVVASPLVPGVSPTVAAPVFDELHVAAVVRFWVELSV
jgi:hypothetical protein